MFTKTTRKIKSAALIALLTASAFQSKAAVFTAVASGNFNASSTWGGTAPGSILTSDVIIIPLGIDVTLTDDVTFSSSASLTVLGTLRSSSTGGDLIMSSGSLAGAGSIMVDSLALGLTSGISFLGNITADRMTSTGANISSAANIYVRKTLMLSSGTMNMASGMLKLGAGSSIVLSGGSLDRSGLGVLSMDSTYNVVYRLGATSTGLELTGDGLDSVTVDVSSTLSLTSNTELDGVLTLQSGIFALNNNTLTLSGMGNISTMGTGTISGSSFSNLIINTSASISGSLRFTSGSNLLNNFTINTGSSSSSVGLGSDLNVNGTLRLQSGRIRLGSSSLIVNAGGTVMGGSSNSFVVTDGSGRLTLNLMAGSTDTFYVGTMTDFTPIAITANSGSVTSDVSLNVTGSVMANGTSGSLLSSTQPMVRNTWFITSSATTGINFNLTAMWNSGLEVNGFNRSQAYISHYTGGSWDATTSSAATNVSGGLYAMTRAGITSLSPFMVTDKDAVTTSIKSVSTIANDVVLYPSPAGSTLNIKSAQSAESAKIYNAEGKLVKAVENINNNTISVSELPTGIYIIHLNGKNLNTVQKFEKQ